MSGYESQNTLAVNNIGASSGTYQKLIWVLNLRMKKNVILLVTLLGI